MNELSTAQVLEQADAAAATGDWEQAYGVLLQADRAGLLEGTDLSLFANIAYAAGHLDVTINVWERLHAESVTAGDHLSAAGAAVRVAMHLLFDTALMAPVRGWIRRAEQHLVHEGETGVHAWLAVVRNYERMLSGDFKAARNWARQAVELGGRHDVAAAALGRVAEARSLIFEGEVRDGLTLLEDAAMAVVSGDLDPLSTGIVYCELVCAWQGVGQYDLAEQWTEAMERWRHGQPVGSIHGRCRVHSAEIMRLRGDSAAEREALLACEELRPYLRREMGWPLTELGRIRLQNGDLRGAEEAFLSAQQAGWDPQPGLALLYLAQGKVDLAVSSIRDALEHPANVPSKELPPNTELRRAPILEAMVEIEIAAGELDRARVASAAFGRIAASYESKSLAAGAAVANARVSLAEGKTTDARRQLDEGVRLWSEVRAPYEVGVCRMERGKVHRAAGSDELALQEFKAAQAIFEQIGARLAAARAAQACGDPRLTATTKPEVQVKVPTVSSTRDGTLCEFRREGDYWSVVFSGRISRLRDLRGLQYLARLLAEPGQEFHVLDLVTTERMPVSDQRRPDGLDLSSPHFGPLLDAQAKEAYRRRLNEIEEDVQDAISMGDSERAAAAREERDFLIRELARAVGLGGRDRVAGSPSERARASVTRALRTALSRIRQHNESLAAHLDHSIQTGTYCAYKPDPATPVAWTL